MARILELKITADQRTKLHEIQASFQDPSIKQIVSIAWWFVANDPSLKRPWQA